jgi:hypothetical protein
MKLSITLGATTAPEVVAPEVVAPEVERKRNDEEDSP